MDPWLIVLIVVVSLLLIFLIGYLLSGLFAIHIFLSRGSIRRLFDAYAPRFPDYGKVRSNFDQEWADDTDINKQVHVASKEGKDLNGILARHEKSDKFIIHFPGYGSSPAEQNKILRKFYEKDGFSILSVEERAHGKSALHHVTLGIREADDAIRWIDYVIKLDPDAEIFLYGDSMGGAIIMDALKNKMPANVKGLIIEDGYGSIPSEMRIIGKQLFPLANTKLVVSSVAFELRFIGLDIRKDLPRDGLKDCDVPCLFIEGGKDVLVPLEEKKKNVAVLKKGTPSREEVFPEAGHVLACYVDEDRYMKVFRSFMADCLSGKLSASGTRGNIRA